MKRSKQILVAAPALGCLLFLGTSRGQKPDRTTVSGAVVDARSLAPVAGVEVAWRSQTERTDAAGRYTIQLPAGIREVRFTATGRRPVTKVLVLRQPGARATQDVLLSDGAGRKALALDRGSLLGEHGKDLESDVSGGSAISVADEYGNDDRLLPLGKARVHSPAWLSANTVAFGREGVLHDARNARRLGVFQVDVGTGDVRQLASGVGAHFVAASPRKDALVIADQKDVYVLPSLADPKSLRRIYSVGANRRFILSVAWSADDRIYFTVEDWVAVDERRSSSRSRIASIRPDGSSLVTDWASDPQLSFRYPMAGEGAEILFGRFALDGSGQALWRRDLRAGRSALLVEPALRAIHLDTKAGRLYYIHRQDLHLRDLASGGDWVIVNSVREGDFLRADRTIVRSSYSK
jgi:hypothetical protein